MTATLNSRFTMPQDPQEMLRLLQTMRAAGAPPYPDSGFADPGFDPAAFGAMPPMPLGGMPPMPPAPPQRNGRRKPSANGAANGSTQKPAADGRDEQGRFTKGNRGGPGNPYNRQSALVRQRIIA